MNDIQKQISKILWDFQSLREEHIYKLLECQEKDINYLIARKVIVKNTKNKILSYNNNKGINSRNVIAFVPVAGTYTMDFKEAAQLIMKNIGELALFINLKYLLLNFIE